MDSEEMLTRIFLSPDSVTLSQEQVGWATELSRQLLPNQAEQKWQTYLTALALLGVEQWLQERVPKLSFNSEWLQCELSSLQRNPAQIATLPTSIGQITIGEFQLYLVTTDNPSDDEVLMPKVIVERAEQVPHFYLLVEVLEELAQVKVFGYLPANQLVEQRQSLELEDDETYIVPLNWFDSNTGNLLLYLQHLDPTALTYPELASLTTPPLPHSSTPTPPISSLSQRAINAKLWLSNQIDQLAQDLAWVLLPPTLNPAMRSMRFTSDQLDLVMRDLIARRVIEMPPQIGSAYHDIRFEATALRLYAVTWELLRIDESPEWMLLLILGTPTGTPLPAGVRLQVHDETQLLVDSTPEDSQASYLYAQVSGGQDEQFYVTVSLDSMHITLSPIAFTHEVSM